MRCVGVDLADLGHQLRRQETERDGPHDRRVARVFTPCLPFPDLVDGVLPFIVARDAAVPEASVSEALLAIVVFGGPVLDEHVLVDLAWITAGIDQGLHQADGHLGVVSVDPLLEALGPHAVAGAYVVREVHVLFDPLPGLEL